MGEQDAAVRAGHISFEQAEGIAGRSGKARTTGPRTVEVLGYFGAVALAVATIVFAVDTAFGDGGAEQLIFGRFDNVPAGLIAMVGAAILLVFGIRFTGGSAGAVRRSGSFTLLAAYLLASVSFGFLLYDLDLGDFTPLARLLPVAAVAIFIWLRSPSVPTQLALFSTAVSAVNAILVLIQVVDPIEPNEMIMTAALGGTPDTGGWIALTVATALGVFWILLGGTGRLRTRNAAFVLGASYAFANSIQLFATDDGWTVLSVVLAAGFAWGAANWGSSVLGAFATVSVIALVAQFIAILVDSPTPTTFVVAYGVPGALALIGAWWFTRSAPKPMAPAAVMAPVAAAAAVAAVSTAAVMASTASKPAPKKAPAKKATTAKKTTTAKKATSAKKTSTAKKSTTAKKPVKKAATTKKPAAKKKPTR